MDNLGKRLNTFIERHLFMSVREFESSIDVPYGTINRAITKGANIGIDKLQKIADTYPELSIKWLLLGKGHMISSNIIVSEEMEPYKTEDQLREAVSNLSLSNLELVNTNKSLIEILKTQLT